MAFLTILGTAVATAIAAQGALWVKEKWVAGAEGRFSALYAALFFEEYASACSHRLGEYSEYISSSGHAGVAHGALPELPDFPTEIDWRRVGIRRTEDAFAYRVKHAAASAKIAYLYDFDPPDGGDHELVMQLIGRGLDALALGAKIRKSGRLKAKQDPDSEYTVERHLTDQRMHGEDIRQKYLASQAASHAALVAGAAPRGVDVTI
ncbi:hypothetical protein [Sphingobium terrigena]|nr:hypothetical protein [Sphingobium terrigena]|tara:strand:- start:1111 stop:1731 length:621 start_codon:yes stop_codon:yes gene_type:complete